MTFNAAEEIKSRLDIIDVISEYVDLKKSGSNYRALCPFHSEKTPSFMVSPQKQIFHCFGCGAGGDIFGFIMRYDNVSFPEALSTLAKKAGVEVRGAWGQKSVSGTDILYTLHEDAAGFYVSQLEKTGTALSYLIGRGFDRETIKEFRLGYAPARPDSLLTFLRGKGYGDRVVETAGLARFSDDRKPHDMFRDRIVFPINDAGGRVIAFGARIMGNASGSKAPKYLNSPETPIFKKGENLYGLGAAREHIRKKGYAVISEGYTDVIMFHQHGIRTAVAPLGTALTEGHLKKIRAYAKKLLLVFDGDEAGLKAARRSLQIIYENGLRAKVLLLPEGHDPDTFLREKGAREFQKLFPRSKDIVDFYLGLREDRVELIRELMELSAKIRDAILRGQIVTEISQKTGIAGVYLVEEIQKIMKPEKKHNEKTVKSLSSPEETLLTIAFLRPEHYYDILAKLGEQDFENELGKRVFLKARQLDKSPALDTISSLFDHEEVSYITSLTIRTGFDEEELNTIIDDCLKKLRTRVLKKKIDDMELRIKMAESSGDFSVLDSLLSKKQAILKEARKNEGIL
jgi:DNA primase